jgi:deoxyribodipyrimidine photo-lyase
LRGDARRPGLPGVAPGAVAGQRQLRHFLGEKLAAYGDSRNDPAQDGQSGLSPYLHFGQLSAQRVYLEVIRTGPLRQSQEAFLEELIVRRELADNFCHYNPDYDNSKGFPAWARETLKQHCADRRSYLYGAAALAAARTHDPAWNAAQRQLVETGKMHGYMRMYWAKKILEWTSDPDAALAIAIELNNHYSLDGRDPNGYAGIAWSIGGVHDRPWGERAIFGKIRYMNAAGLRRKFKDLDAYITCFGGNLNVASAPPS